METCTEIQARRENHLNEQFSQFPDHRDYLSRIGFHSSTLNENFDNDCFANRVDSCE